MNNNRKIVFVAGASREYGRCRAAMDRVIAHPRMELAIDWLRSLDEEREKGRMADESTLRAHAEKDLTALQASDYLWFLSPQEPSCGSHAELGLFMAEHALKRIVVSGRVHNIYALRCHYRFDSDLDGWSQLNELVKA